MFELSPPQDDGLYIPTVGEWSRDKHYYLCLNLRFVPKPQFPSIIRCPFHFISKHAHTYCIYNSFLKREEEISKIVVINKTVF